MDIIKLLFIEDDEDFAYIITNSLDSLGYYIICTAYDGEEGLDMYKLFEPDIIVTDIEMPKMDGKDLVRKIRENDAYTPVIFETVYKEPKNFVEGLDLGADSYLFKPITPEKIDAAIRALMKRSSYKSFPVRKNEDYAIGSYGFSVSKKYLNQNDKLTKLTDREVQILDLLVSNKGQLVKRKVIFDKLGKECDFFSSRTLDVQILNIRRKLRKDNSVQIITVHGEGFILKDGFTY